jgi:hypothetical protein
MLKLGTRLSLGLLVVCGIGIGVLSSWADGLFSAICLLIFPLLVAATATFIIRDLSAQPADLRRYDASDRRAANAHDQLPHAA